MSETYATLLAERAAIQAKIEAQEAQEKADAIAELRKTCADFRITAEDIFGKRTGSNVVKIRAKVKAKYQNPQTGATWSGRGKPPKWIQGQERAPFLLAA